MPCYTKQSITINWGNANEERVRQAMEDIGLRTLHRGVKWTGEVKIVADTVEKAQSIEKQLRRRYAELTVEEAAKKHRWQLKSQTTAKGEKVYQVMRR